MITKKALDAVKSQWPVIKHGYRDTDNAASIIHWLVKEVERLQLIEEKTRALVTAIENDPRIYD